MAARRVHTHLCDHPHRALAIGVDALRELYGIRCGDVGIRRGHREDERIGVLDVRHHHVAQLGLDVRWLIGDGDLGDSRQINKREVKDVRRIYAKPNRLARYTLC